MKTVSDPIPFPRYQNNEYFPLFFIFQVERARFVDSQETKKKEKEKNLITSPL